MKKILIIIIILIVVIVASVTAFRCLRMGENKPKVSAVSTCALKTDMRNLWNDHASWTREVIIAIVDNTPGRYEAIDRLLKNQDDIGNAIKPYYGEAAGKELTRLLREHIVVAADVVVATRDNNKLALEKSKKRWFKNSAEIAEFLSKANPKLDAANIRYMMDYHLRLTNTEAVTRILKQYQRNIESYDKVHNELMDMSDMISQGIIDQFPEKFACEKEEGGAYIH